MTVALNAGIIFYPKLDNQYSGLKEDLAVVLAASSAVMWRSFEYELFDLNNTRQDIPYDITGLLLAIIFFGYFARQLLINTTRSFYGTRVPFLVIVGRWTQYSY
jgi:hypothetical protein